MAATRHQRTLRATLTGLAVNCLLAGGKLAAGMAGRSDALIADAVESLADILGALIVWHGLAVSARPADDEHPYGHGKAESLAAAAIGTLLLLAASGIGLHGIRGFLTPHPPPATWTLAVLLGVLGVKEALFRWVLREADATDSSAVRSDAWHHRSDAITSLAAAIGIGLSVGSGGRWAGADDAAAVVAALVIAWNGWRILRPALEELMDTQPSPALVRRIRDLAAGVPGVDRVQKCFARRTGYQFLVDMHVHVDPQMTVVASHALAHAVKDRVRDGVPQVRDVLIHIEPSAPGSGPRPG
ncbi:MAG: cation diffusion facilitator family transporter [Verrucomicrobiota bacterium]